MKYLILILIGVAALMSLEGCSGSHFYDLPTLEFDQVDYGFPTSTKMIRNIKVAYIEQGRGRETLLLVHGLGSNAKGWLKNIPAWAERYRVIAVDLPGYGKSDKGYYEYSMSFNAEVLFELMDELDIERFSVVGHSMGGQIGMHMALQRPERLQRLVLISPAGFERFEEGEGQWLERVMTPELVQDTPIRNIAVNLKLNFYDKGIDADFMIADRIQVRGAGDFDRYCYAVSKNVAGMINEPVWDKLERIITPTLIIFGENDALIPNPYLHGGLTKEIAAIGVGAIPNNQLLLVPECGHFAQYEKAEETNRSVLDFLR
ncbi:MAG: alpha/beta hydrolase [bacterium]|nr:alpha/beta hydrolase [bacterium]